jgi:NAD(P)-dependent dehydrogenase (short-subunit alcohol dehydrogenase family)
MKTNSPSNRVALVTGGSRGIGAAIVRRLIQEEVAVAFTYSSAQEKALTLVAEIEGRGARALAIQADSANATEVRDAVSKTVEAFGRLNILVNNAGILLRGTIDTFSLEDFDRMVAVNVRPVFAGAQAASRHMEEGSRIIVIGSTKAGPASDLEARPRRKKFVRRTAQKPQSKRKTIMANRQLNMNDASVVQAQTAPSGHVSTLYPTVAAIFRRWPPASGHKIGRGDADAPDMIEHHGENFNEAGGNFRSL